MQPARVFTEPLTNTTPKYFVPTRTDPELQRNKMIEPSEGSHFGKIGIFDPVKD